MSEPIRASSSHYANVYSLSNLISDIADDLRFYGGDTVRGRLLTVVCDLRFRLVLSYRISRHLGQRSERYRWLQKCIAFRQQTRGGNQISPKACIGRRLALPHPVGIVIGAGVMIEDSVTLYQHVTLGSHGRRHEAKGYPILRTGARVYAGACIIGDVAVGKDAVVAANSVVLTSIQDGATVAGAPARAVGSIER